jgi:hypothetical protein
MWKYYCRRDLSQPEKSLWVVVAESYDGGSKLGEYLCFRPMPRSDAEKCANSLNDESIECGDHIAQLLPEESSRKSVVPTFSTRPPARKKVV